MGSSPTGQSFRIGDELRQLSRLAAPVVVANAGHALMGIVDTAVVGRVGASAQAAVGIGTGLFFIVSALGIGVMMGLDPLISQAFGSGRPLQARQLHWQGVWLSVAGAVVLAPPLLVADRLMEPFGVQPEIALQARDYLLWRATSILPLLLFFGTKAYLMGAGRPGVLAVATAVANVANLLLDVLLVLGGEGLPPWCGPLRDLPALGAAGAGIATALVVVLQWGIVTWRVHRLPADGLRREHRRPEPGMLRAALGVGIPSGLQMSAEVGVFAIASLLAGSFDATSGAAHQIAIACASFTFCVALGFSSAGSVRVGWAVGAGRTAAARRSGVAALFAGGGSMLVFALAFIAFPRAIAGVMSGGVGPVLEATVGLLVVVAVFQVADGLQAVGAGILRGAGETRFTFVANLAGHYGVGLPLALVLGVRLGGGVTGVWWGLCAGLFVVAGLLVVRFLVRTSREIAPLSVGAPRAPTP